MKTKRLALLALLGMALPLSSQTSLSGRVTDNNGEPLMLCSVALYKTRVLITGTETDFDGNYHFASLDPGIYTVEASYVGYTKRRFEQVRVYAGKAIQLDIEMSPDVVFLDAVVVTSYKIPVETYRLIGYENRLLAKEDFEDDAKDAGELGAGHTVTALYEIVLKAGAQRKPLGTLHLRYKDPAESQSRYLKHKLSGDLKPFEQASGNFRFAAAVATYARYLRASKYKGQATLKLARELAEQALQDDPENYRADFVELIKQTETLTEDLAPQPQPAYSANP